MLGIRIKAGIAGMGTFAAIAAVAASPAGVSASTCGSSGGVSLSCGSKGYVNPFKHERWYAGRIDMGVDYMPRRRERVRAIGDAKILGASTHSGWPGGGFMWYRLLNGDHQGDIIYVAEDLKRVKHHGKVRAGQRIATTYPGATGTEWGWASKAGQPRAARCYSEGMQTNSGDEMARFLKHLGAPLGDKPGPGPDEPKGKRC